MKLISEVYSLETVKEDLDAYIRSVLLETEGYEEVTTGTDIKILLGVLSSILTGILLVLSVFYDFEVYKTYGMFLVLFFWIFSYTDFLLSRFVFHHTFTGTKSQKHLSLITKLDPPISIYTALFYFNKKEIPTKFAVDIAHLYNENQELNQKELKRLLKEALTTDTSNPNAH
ncbi:hypothetical protein NEFER03_0901 [Nematocida sp. LUAm3]|nr:hypothetical protein NEFER03_0901 [Nematocida sp. LUAm3]KAI5174919.1 hypothetical protein NEFER02_1019 [Nematocida sp. LUAm2]KAI5177482.1 hypothetical protein NEFER01_0732 [Nematocida sp. LUAm1]